jgi:hypothetical protein
MPVTILRVPRTYLASASGDKEEVVGKTALGTMKSLWVRQMGHVLLVFFSPLVSSIKRDALLDEVRWLAEPRQFFTHSGKSKRSATSTEEINGCQANVCVNNRRALYTHRNKRHDRISPTIQRFSASQDICHTSLG